MLTNSGGVLDESSGFYALEPTMPEYRTFEVRSAGPEGEVELEIVNAHCYDCTNGPGHLIFIDIDSKGHAFHRRVFNASCWKSVTEVASITPVGGVN